MEFAAGKRSVCFGWWFASGHALCHLDPASATEENMMFDDVCRAFSCAARAIFHTGRYFVSGGRRKGGRQTTRGGKRLHKKVNQQFQPHDTLGVLVVLVANPPRPWRKLKASGRDIYQHFIAVAANPPSKQAALPAAEVVLVRMNQICRSTAR